MQKLIYVASPYTVGNQEHNVLRQIAAGEILAKYGFVAQLPLLSHYWNKIYLHSYDFWIKNCLVHLSKCDGLLRLQGESKGADKEVEFAQVNNIPVFYSFEDVNTYFN